MNRFGKAVAAIVVLLLVVFAALVRCSGGGRPADPPQGRPAGEADTLLIPVAGVPASALVDGFGDPRDGGERSHGALDIAAPRGTPVLAAAAGTLEKIFESEAGGHTLYVRSPDRLTIYYYAHLDTYAPAMREGAPIVRGERIGTVGSSGNADPAGPHLHFAIRRMMPGQPWHEGVAVDPYPLLAGKVAGG